MKTFTDNAGRTWSVVLNVDAVKRVRALLDVNLLDAVDGRLLERLASDPVLLCDVLYAVCKAQADAEGVSDEEFGRAMAGDAIDAAATAFLEELVDFFPQGRRGLLRKALEKLRKLEAMALDAAGRKLDGEELERQMAELIERGDSSGNSPESSASTPAP